MAVTTAFVPTGTLADIVPAARPKFEQLLAQATAWGMQPRIRGAGRTCAMQEAISAGATRAGMCRSVHVIHRALDIDLSPGGCETYTKLGQFWESIGGTWGGRWTSIWPDCGDRGHFHYLPPHQQAVPTSICPKGLTLEQCEAAREAYLRQQFGVSGGVPGWAWGVGIVSAGVAAAAVILIER